MSPELVDWIWRAVLGLVVALVLYLIKDRRRTKLENDLADKTLEPKTKKVGIEALDGQILAMSKAWEEERASKDRRIQDLLQQLEETQNKLAIATTTVEEMKAQASTMQAQLDSFKEQLERFTKAVEEEKA